MDTRSLITVIVLLIAASGCDHYGSGDTNRLPQRSLFASGCPAPGLSSAKLIDSLSTGMVGADAIGTVGDYLLMNEKAAFIIEGVEHVNTYHYYGGIPIDAVALENCAQLGPEQFEEMGIMMGTLDASDPLSSSLRGFRGDRVEIVNDGSDGGAAVVRVYGADDYYWLVEYTLIKEVYIQAKKAGIDLVKPLSPPLGVDFYIDYILEPGSRTLRIELNMANQDDAAKEVLAGMGNFFGDSTNLKYYYDDSDGLLGFTMKSGVPYLVSSSGTGAYALGMEDAIMATTNISGVDAALDFDQVDNPVALAPAGQPGDSAKLTYYFAVGGSDFNSALSELHVANPHPLPGWSVSLVSFGGKVTSNETGEPIGDAWVELQKKNTSGGWRFVDAFISDENGEYGGLVPSFGDQCRVVATKEGMPDAAPAEFIISDGLRVDVGFDSNGWFAWEVFGPDGNLMPAKLILWDGSNEIMREYSGPGKGVRPIPPGTYGLSVTRGFEYTTYQGTVDVIAGQTAFVSVALDRPVDTAGYMSMDAHMHAGPSGDNKISIPERIRTVAAEGLEVAIGTDHEAIIPWSYYLWDTSLAGKVALVTGQEVTATIPEHTNMYPVLPDFSKNIRGGYVEWWRKSLGEIFAAERERGAVIRQLNHPRAGCNYLCLIGYNRFTGQADLADGTKIGLEPGAELMSFDFESIEVMNGIRSPFADPGNPDETGNFDDWMSFLNHGHIINAVGNSDVHNFGWPGYPRNYFRSSSDDPSAFSEDELVDSVLKGNLEVSTGAFANVKLNGSAEMGDIVTDSDGFVDLYIKVQALPEIDVTDIMVFVNCDEAMSITASSPDATIKHEATLSIPVSRDAHIVVAGFGTKKLPRGMHQFDPSGIPRFITNAIFVDFDGNGAYDPPGDKNCSYTLP